MARILGPGGGAQGGGAQGGGGAAAPYNASSVAGDMALAIMGIRPNNYFDQLAAGMGGYYDDRAARATQLGALRNLLGAPPDASLAGGMGNLSVISGQDRVALPDDLLKEAILGGAGGIVEPLAKKKKDQFQQMRIDPISGMVF